MIARALTSWDDLVARSRGMSAHLLSRDALAELARSPNLSALADRLASRGLISGGDRTPAAIERSLRRVRADRLARLARWSGDRREALAVIFDDEDRRSLDRILRAIASGSTARVLAGLTPTPALTERELQTLAEQKDARAVASLLVAWGHPYGPPLLRADDLIAQEHALHATFARRAAAGARRGDAALRAYTGALIDVENALQLLVSVKQPAAARDPEAWLPGGLRLDHATWRRLLDGDRPAVIAALGAALGDDLAAAVRDAGLGEAERAVLRPMLLRWRRAALREPLTTAPILRFALGLRAEAVDLRTVVWGVALGAPSANLVLRLVTP